MLKFQSFEQITIICQPKFLKLFKFQAQPKDFHSMQFMFLYNNLYNGYIVRDNNNNIALSFNRCFDVFFLFLLLSTLWLVLPYVVLILLLIAVLFCCCFFISVVFRQCFLLTGFIMLVGYCVLLKWTCFYSSVLLSLFSSSPLFNFFFFFCFLFCHL